MDRNLFRYVWRHSRRDQIVILALVLASLPFYFASLDLPRRIVNEAIQGRAFPRGQAETVAFALDWPAILGGGTLFQGIIVDRYGLLYVLSALFLLLVIVKGLFKYRINLSKGALGERMLRRMRFELVALAMRFTPEALRSVKATEVATIVKDEVEPIGGFIGDAFVLPAFLGAQAATALAFILLQNIWLGIVAIAVVSTQFLIIPRLRRELLKLGRERQLTSRRLSSRVAEIVEGSEAVKVHGTGRWERAEVGDRLYRLFDLRFRIYERKFIVKFLNNFLAQLTPFLFYAIGGYFALSGQLDIGQLVAVIAAYRELPPPLKELIDWDQQRLDVQVKYDQVVQQFAPERLAPEAAESSDEAPRLLGPFAATQLTAADHAGRKLFGPADFALSLPGSAAITGDPGGASALARVIAGRRAADGDGRLAGLSASALMAVAPRRIGYVGPDPILFPVSLRENLVYGLRRNVIARAPEDARRRREAERTGNPLESTADDWIDFAAAGATSEADLDRRLVEILRELGMGDDLYEFGVAGMVAPERHERLTGEIVRARRLLRERLARSGDADLVEPFDLARYSARATIAENLLFGVPIAKDLIGRAAGKHPGLRKALRASGLEDALVEIGGAIASTMVEIFRDLPPGHPLYEQFSFIAAEEQEEYATLVQRRAAGVAPNSGQRTRLIALSLDYVEPRHRLGLIDEKLAERLVRTRALVREAVGGKSEVAFYDPDVYCAAAPLRDNLLFGRIDQGIADARGRVLAAIAEVVDELGLRDAIAVVGLDHQVGPAGRQLTAAQRVVTDIARNLVKRPDVLVVDGSLAALGDQQADAVGSALRAAMSRRTLILVTTDPRRTVGFDQVVEVQTSGAVTVAPGQATKETA